ncbi:MAG: adenosylmethionine--8-amino-7-oxononanoate transaminase [Chlamydiales bacterium]|nr:adenosylmethionine--8-amino-7-oxononanoate transaminase [Chlamydiales bacterium]
MEDKTTVQDAHYLETTNVWAPFTQHQTSDAPIPVVKASGAYLHAADGSRYLDAISSWWVTLHGHCHPYIARKIAEQATQLEHVMLAGFTHPPACELAQRLTALLPANLTRVFYSDNGSTAVETALKIALQYWHNRNEMRPRTKVVTLKGGYHGDTVGAMSLSDRSFFTRPFEPILFDVISIDPPFIGSEEASLDQLKAALANDDVACFIYEPGLQGVGGMISHSLEGLDALIGLCRQHNVLTIADEVLVGCGRTGPLFVSNAMANAPDMVCLAKGLTGGFLPLAATVCSEHLFEAFLSDELKKALLHGHSYAGNPIGCAAALANLDLLEDPLCAQQRQFIEQKHRAFQQKLLGHPGIKRCEVIGTILIVDYRNDHASSYYNPLRNRLASFFLNRHVLLRPFGNTVHAIPPYCVDADDLQQIYDALEASLTEVP